MINKKYYCNICDKYFVNKGSHSKSKFHTQLSLSVVNKYSVVDVPVIEIDNVLNKYVCDYNKKFRIFDHLCIIQNEHFCERIRFAPDIVVSHGELIKIQEEIIRRYKCRQDDLVYMEIIFITDLKSATYNHYFQLPRPMIERKICQIIDRNPNLIKILDHMPKSYKNHIIVKHWGIRYEDDEKVYINVPYNWMDLEPNV